MVKFLIFILLILLPIIFLNLMLNGLFRFFGFNPRQRQQNAGTRQKKPGSVNIDYVPKNGKEKFGDNFKGGEYVDYEEVK